MLQIALGVLLFIIGAMILDLILIPQVKVYAVNDCDWWAGHSAGEVLAKYMEITGVSHEEATGDESALPKELTDEEMRRLVFTYEDHRHDWREAGEGRHQASFRERLEEMVAAGGKFPCFFATTEV